MSTLLPYVGRRLLSAAALVLIVSSGAMFLVRLAPGDPAAELLGAATDRTIARERVKADLDRPILQQYVQWLSRSVRLDLGTSTRYGRSVNELVRERAWNTILLAAAALVLATLVGIPCGVFSGSGHSAARQAVRATSMVLLSLPPLATALLLAFFAARTGWFPVGGLSAGADSGLLDRAWHLVLPALALALPIAATLERLQAQAIGERMTAPYVRAALARGLPTARVLWRHAFRNALPPILGIYGIIIGSLFSGSFAVEMVMAWPGLGRLMYDALLARDVYLVAGCAAVGAIVLSAGTLLSDLALAYVDPRVREAAG